MVKPGSDRWDAAAPWNSRATWGEARPKAALAVAGCVAALALVAPAIAGGPAWPSGGGGAASARSGVLAHAVGETATGRSGAPGVRFGLAAAGVPELALG